MKTKMINILLFLFSTLMMPVVAAATDWNLYTYISTTNVVPGQAMQDLAKQIGEDSGGDLNIRVYLGGSLPIKATNITQAVSQGGTIQLADDGFPYGNVPVAGILNLPMLLTSEAQFNKALEAILPDLKKSFAEQGIELLVAYHYPLQVLWSREELTSFDDIEGMKIRVSSPQQAAFINAFGGTPVTIGTPEVAPALQRGVVDGVITASTGGGSIWEDLLSHSYRLGPNFFTSYILVNKAAFEALDPALQKIVRKQAEHTAERTTLELRESEQSTTDRMASDGMIVTPAKDEDIREGTDRMRDYWDEWATDQGVESIQALEKVRHAIR